MVYDLFPTRVLIEDNCLSPEQLQELEVAINSVFYAHQAQTGSHVVSGEDSMPLFTEENMSVFPVIRELRTVFLDAFCELAKSNAKNCMSREDIETMLNNHAGRLPIMRTGDFKAVHAHPGTTAFAVFYITTVDNEREGGQLVLRDPTFHVNPGFKQPMTHRVDTVAGRLIVAPSYLWHEVTPYTGKKDRLTVVSNLSFLSGDIAQSL